MYIDIMYNPAAMLQYRINHSFIKQTIANNNITAYNATGMLETAASIIKSCSQPRIELRKNTLATGSYTSSEKLRAFHGFPDKYCSFSAKEESTIVPVFTLSMNTVI